MLPPFQIKEIQRSWHLNDASRVLTPVSKQLHLANLAEAEAA